MGSVCLRFILISAFILAVGGCGSSGSPANNDTGSLAAKLIWSSPGAKTTAKTLYAAPAEVLEIQIIVSAADMQGTVSNHFLAAAGTGTLNGIPAGTGRTVTVNGLISGGTIGYQGITTVDIVAGQTATVAILMGPVTTASPRGGTYPAPQSVTLTASVPATIYYTTSTTNGVDPTTSSPQYLNPIEISGHIFLKFFAVDAGNIAEAVKTEEYFTP